MYSITQIIVTRDSKAALSLLLAKGQIGDELWERFLAAEKELEIEIVEVCEEAETWMVGYGKIIFGVAADMIAHEGIKKAFEDIEGKRNIESTFSVASLFAYI
jgi:translocation protein SEC66